MWYKRSVLKFLFFFIFLSLFPADVAKSDSFIIKSGLPQCSTNNYVVTYTTATNSYVCAAAPGASGGEANTTSNEGGGEGLAMTKVGVNLPFKTLTEGTGISLTGSADEVEIAADFTPSSTDELTNKTFNADGTGNSITNIENADIKAGAAIDASKLADGSVSNTELQYINTLSSNAQTQINGKLDSDGDGLVDQLDGHINNDAMEVKSYYLRQNARYPFTINSVWSQCASGTATFDLEIDGTDVTGCAAQGMSSSEATDTCTAANTVSVGETVTLNITAISSPVDCRWSIQITRD